MLRVICLLIALGALSTNRLEGAAKSAEIFQGNGLILESITLKIGESSDWIDGDEKVLVLFTNDGLARFHSENCPTDVKVVKKNKVLQIKCSRLQIQNISNHPLQLYIIEKKN